MLSSVKSKAEEQFAATQKKHKPALTEKQKAGQERTQHVASLRALRLAKEAADKEAAEEAGADKRATKNKMPSRLLQANQR